MVGLLGGGGYAEKVAANPASLTWPVPDGVTDEQALAVVLQGATAWHLLRTSAHLRRGRVVVVIAGAGGVGTLAIQLAKRWGAGRVIATASSPEKRELTQGLGARRRRRPGAGRRRPKSFTAALREANGGERVDIVLEMTGGHVFDGSLAALAPFGRLVAYGMAGRVPPKPVEPAVADGHAAAPSSGSGWRTASAAPGDDGRRHERAAAAGRRRRAEAGRRRPLPAGRRPRGAPGPAGPPHHRQAGPRPDR